MQDLQSYLDRKLERDDEFVVPPHRSADDRLDQLGITASLILLCIGLLIAALSVVNRAIARCFLLPMACQARERRRRADLNQ
jgi:hypothetical protein